MSGPITTDGIQAMFGRHVPNSPELEELSKGGEGMRSTGQNMLLDKHTGDKRPSEVVEVFERLGAAGFRVHAVLDWRTLDITLSKSYQGTPYGYTYSVDTESSDYIDRVRKVCVAADCIDQFIRTLKAGEV